MSPASYLTAPPRVADTMVALRGATVSIAAMVGFWLALALLLCAVIAGLAYAVVRGLQLYRKVKRTGAAFTARLDVISATVASIERHAAAAGASTQRLAEANGRLQRSRARLDVQLAAMREARAQVRRVFWFVPGI